jgi:outer membrane protein assembly factor BamE (lipoprotein component of BamABCDE complex)
MRVSAKAALGVGLAAFLAGCAQDLPVIGTISETSHHGYLLPPSALEQVPVGSSRDQVLIALGSPSTTAQFGGEVFYYISQTRVRPVAFMDARVVDQRVLAVYFDERDRVTQIADYGLQDGRVFDFITRTTPTGGRDINFLAQLLGAAPSLGSIGGQEE